MSSPTSTPPLRFVLDPSDVSTTRKRTLVYVDEKERNDKIYKKQAMPSFELSPSAFVPNMLSDLVESSMHIAPTRKIVRILPLMFTIPPAESPQSSQGSLVGSVGLGTLEYAKIYLDTRVDRSVNDTQERHQFRENSPNGSEDSNQVTYSQDSQLSGAEPPTKFDVARAIANTLSEERLQQLFSLGDTDDEGVRLDKMLRDLKDNIRFFRQIVEEAIGVAKEASAEAIGTTSGA